MWSKQAPELDQSKATREFSTKNLNSYIRWGETAFPPGTPLCGNSRQPEVHREKAWGTLGLYLGRAEGFCPHIEYTCPPTGRGLTRRIEYTDHHPPSRASGKRMMTLSETKRNIGLA